MEQKICLVMIVKNEEHVIGRCLKSVLPIIDAIYISDTGSTDNTSEEILEFSKDNNITAVIVNNEWKDFATNRTLAILGAKERFDEEFDYFLMIDADEVIIYEDNLNVEEFKNNLTKDIYDVVTNYGTMQYLRPQLFKANIDCKYTGVLHEYLEVISKYVTKDILPGISNYPVQDSARSKNPNKFKDDAAILLTAYEDETSEYLKTRYAFYLAQSYKDANDLFSAIHWYDKRSKMGGWIDEVYLSLLNRARLMERLVANNYAHYSNGDIVTAYISAYESLPTRAEAIHDLVKYLRSLGKNKSAYLYAQEGLQLEQPIDGLFVESWIYEYGLLDEYSIVSYYVGDYNASYDTCITLLSENKYPQEYKNRIVENAKFSVYKLKNADYYNELSKYED